MADGETVRVLARMLADRDRFWSAGALQSSTMKLRQMAEAELVHMSLSKNGIPHYQITAAGEQLAVENW